MRNYRLPPKRTDIGLPRGFSKQFIQELQASITVEEHGYKAEYLHRNLLSKYLDPKVVPESVREDRAIEKWLSCEHRNAKTNFRIFHQDVVEKDLGWTDFSTLLRLTRSLVSRILGPLRYPEVLTNLQHTNGASTRVSRSTHSALHKLVGDAHVSASAVKHWLAAATGTSCLSEQTLQLAESSVLFTVDKNSDINRCACKEPEINMLMQKSVGSSIRHRLLKFGVDLNDQTINQRLAASAVANGLATVDLSSASDSISRQLVESLLPGDWFDLLDDLRVKSTIVQGRVHQLEMFSSMGNGFTFELESLLFYALTSVVCRLSKIRGRISVYGDDIIAPCAVVPRLTRVFHLVGFKINPKKSFWSGPFRESCGKHYYGGFDVSPFFIRREVSQLPDLINILNKLAAWECRGHGFITTPSILAFHRKYANYVPPYLWGGVDTNGNEALVTGHAPRFRLSPKTVDLRRTIWKKDVVERHPQTDLDCAALVHWFMVRENVEQPFNVEIPMEQYLKTGKVSGGWRAEWRPWLLLSD